MVAHLNIILKWREAHFFYINILSVSPTDLWQHTNPTVKQTRID